MQYMAYINENGNTRMASIDVSGSVTVTASKIIETANIRDGAEVLIGWVEFNYPSQRFRAVEYRFTVENGMPKDIKAAAK